jgi:hypothetical protein
MNDRMLVLAVVPGTLALCRFPRRGAIPCWALRAPFFSVTGTYEEISVIAPEASVPEDVVAERGWRAMRVEGTLPLDLTGILDSIARPLAQAKIPIVAMSTYDTDYLLVRERDLVRAEETLTRAGHRIRT